MGFLLALVLSLINPIAVSAVIKTQSQESIVYALGSCNREDPANASKSCTQTELNTWRDEVLTRINAINAQAAELATKPPFKGCSFSDYKPGMIDAASWTSSGDRKTFNSAACRDYIRRGLWDIWSFAPTTARDSSRFSQEFRDLFETWTGTRDMTTRDELFWSAVDKALVYAAEFDTNAWPLVLEAQQLAYTAKQIDVAIEDRKKIDASNSISHRPSDCAIYRGSLVDSYVSSGRIVTFSGGRQSLCRNGKWIDKGKVKLEARFLTCSVFNSATDNGCWVKDSRGFLTWLLDLPQGQPRGKVVSTGSFQTKGGICQVSLYSNFAYRLKCT